MNERMMRRLVAPMVIACAAIAASGACGGQEQGTPPYSGPPDDAPVLSLDDFCAQFAQLSCDIVGHCCTGVPVPSNCSSYGPQFCDELRKSMPGGTQYDPVAGAICIAATREAIPSCGLLSGGATSADRACAFVFDGGVAPGGACTKDSDCAYQRHAVTLCRSGVCTSEPIVGAGAPCTDATCDVDLRCSTSPSSGDAGSDAASGATCVPLAAQGESCATTTCRHDLYCDPSSRTCAARLADGSACASSLSCSSRLCSGGTCKPATTCSFGP
jgi:hypothetical protein